MSIQNQVPGSQRLGGNLFYIMSAMQGSPGTNATANPYVLATDGNTTVIYQFEPGNKYEMWIFNDDGTISPALSPDDALTYSADAATSNQLTISAKVSAPTQVWTYSNGQLFLKIGGAIGNVYMNIENAALADNNAVITYALTSESDELWYLLPVQSIATGTCFYLQTEMPNAGTDNSEYVISLPGSSATAGSQLVLDALQPGALNQLWVVTEDGYFASALDVSMVMSTVTGSNQEVTIQKTATVDYYQQWYLYQNGILANGGYGANYFANVSGAGVGSPGKPIISYDYEFVNNARWRVIPYQPTGLWFTIQSEVDETQLLTLSGIGSVSLQAPQAGKVLKNGQAATNQLWKRTPSGNIESALMPNTVLTLGSDGNVTVAPLLAGSQNQVWGWGNGRVIPLDATTKKIFAGTLSPLSEPARSLTATSAGVVSLSDTNPTVGDSQLWYILPHAIPFGASTVFRNTGPATGAGQLLTLLDDKSTNIGGGYQVVVGEGPTDQSLATWEFLYPGYIVNNANNEFVLSLEIDTGGTIDAPEFTTNVVAYPRLPYNQLFQLWTVTAEGLIVNQYNGQALALPVSGTPPVVLPNAVTTAIATDGQASYQVWEFSAGTAIQAVMAQAELPFPSYEGVVAYKDICDKLGLAGDIRQQYFNLAAPLGSYQTGMNLMLSVMMNESMLSKGARPTEAELKGYTEIITQLNKEISAAMAVQLLFQQVTNLYLSLSQGQALTLSELVTACALPNGVKTIVPPPRKKKSKSWIGDLIEGIAYIGLNVAGSFVGDPEAGEEVSLMSKVVKNGFPCFANIMAAAFTTTTAAMQQPSGAPVSKAVAALQKAEDDFYNYEMTVAGLEKMLLAEFEALGTAIGQVEAFILADWGRLQAVKDMINNNSDIASLFWPATMSAMDTDQMLQSYTLSVLKTLMPANTDYAISATMHTNYGNVGGKGWQNGDFYFLNDDGTESQYSTGASSQVMDIAWANGMNTVSFFRGLNGWNMPTNYKNLYASTNNNTLATAAFCVVTIENCTNETLLVYLHFEGMVACSFANSSGTSIGEDITVPFFSTMQFAGGILSTPIKPSDVKDTVFQPSALRTATTPAVQINLGNATVISFDIDSTYTTETYSNNGDIPPCGYNISNLKTMPPFSCNFTQRNASSPMVFVNVTVTAN